MAFSETVFVYPTDAEAHVRIRIFTPAAEIPFAGHPTLGTAFVLAQPMQLEVIAIETGSGVVPVWLEREGPKIVFGRMHQPIPTVEPFDETQLLAALGVERSELPGRALRQRHALRLRRASQRGRGRCARSRYPWRSAGLRGFGGVNCFAGSGNKLEDAHVRARQGRDRGPGDGLGRRAARRPPRAPRAHRLGRRDPHLAGRGDRPPVDACTRAWTARPTRSSASRSAARPSSSRVASSASSGGACGSSGAARRARSPAALLRPARARRFEPRDSRRRTRRRNRSGRRPGSGGTERASCRRPRRRPSPVSRSVTTTSGTPSRLIDSLVHVAQDHARLLLGELEERHVAEDVAVELVVEANRPDVGAAHEPLAVVRDLAPDRERLHRLGGEVGLDERGDVHPAARRRSPRGRPVSTGRRRPAARWSSPRPRSAVRTRRCAPRRPS